MGSGAGDSGHPEAKRTQVWESRGWEPSWSPAHTRGTGEAKPSASPGPQPLSSTLTVGWTGIKELRGNGKTQLFVSLSHLATLEPDTVSVTGSWLESRARVLRTFQQVQANFLSGTNQSISPKSHKTLTNLHLNQL